jgi:hypothetical protein
MINGALDLQVPADANLNAMHKHLKKAKYKNVIIKIYEGLYHLFQETKNWFS